MRLTSLYKSTLTWAKADLAVKYERSIFGLSWYLVNPLVTFLIVYITFQTNLGHAIPFYGVYIFLGISTFNFFQNAVVESGQILYENRFTIKAISVDLESLILTPLAKSIIGHLFELGLLLLIMVYSNIPLTHIIWYPLFFISLITFTAGFVYLISVIGVFISDISNMVLFALRLLWFATPVFYVLPSQSAIALINTINPFFYIIEFARQTVIFQIFSTNLFIIVLSVSLCSLLTGRYIFLKKQQLLAESI